MRSRTTLMGGFGVMTVVELEPFVQEQTTAAIMIMAGNIEIQVNHFRMFKIALPGY